MYNPTKNIGQISTKNMIQEYMNKIKQIQTQTQESQNSKLA